jgi:hypothetical protein
MAIGTTIGKTMDNGFAGSYSRQPDMIVDTHPAGGQIKFGKPVVSLAGKTIDLPTAMLKSSSFEFTADKFQGVATRETKSALSYTNQGVGEYEEGDAVPVMKRGRVNVLCQKGTPEYNGDVYVRVEENSSYPTAEVGGFEAAADSTKTVKLTNAKWRGAADGNGIAELSILEQINA